MIFSAIWGNENVVCIFAISHSPWHILTFLTWQIGICLYDFCAFFFFSPFRFIRMTNFYGFRWLQKWTVWKKLTQNFLITAVKIGRRILRVFNKSSETQLAFGWFLIESIKNDDRSWWWIVPCLNNLFTNLTYHFCRFSCFLNITANNWFLANYESMINDY